MVLTRHYKSLVLKHAHLGASRDESILDYTVQLYTIPSMTPCVVASHDLLQVLFDSVRAVFEPVLDPDSGVVKFALIARHAVPFERILRDIV